MDNATKLNLLAAQRNALRAQLEAVPFVGRDVAAAFQIREGDAHKAMNAALLWVRNYPQETVLWQGLRRCANILDVRSWFEARVVALRSAEFAAAETQRLTDEHGARLVIRNHFGPRDLQIFEETPLAIRPVPRPHVPAPEDEEEAN